MKKSTISQFLNADDKTLGLLLVKLKQLKQWNTWLRECLEKEEIVADHCQIVNLSGTSLIAFADSPHWLIRIRFYIPELLPKLRRYPGLEKIRALCCKVQPNYIPVNRFKKRQPQQKLQASTAALVKQTAEKIQDKRLREIFEKIAGRAE